MNDGWYSVSREAETSDTARMVLTGEFDLENAKHLTAALLEAIGDPDVTGVVVDMSGTTFLDSSGVKAIVTAYDAAEDAGKPLRLRNLQQPVRRVFEILELTALLQP